MFCLFVSFLVTSILDPGQFVDGGLILTLGLKLVPPIERLS